MLSIKLPFNGRFLVDCVVDVVAFGTVVLGSMARCFSLPLVCGTWGRLRLGHVIQTAYKLYRKIN